MTLATASKNGRADLSKGELATAAPEEGAVVQLEAVALEGLVVPIVGTSPLIQHRWSEKAKREMLDNMTGRKSPRQMKAPQAEYEAALYRFADGGYGMPAGAFLGATIGAARFFPKLTMTLLRQLVFVAGDVGADGEILCLLSGDGPHMREDVVRVQRGTDLRYRPQWTTWSTELRLTYVKSMISRSSVLSLVDAGGLGVGVGEWRPERKGTFGTYRIDPARKVEVVGAER